MNKDELKFLTPNERRALEEYVRRLRKDTEQFLREQHALD